MPTPSRSAKRDVITVAIIADHRLLRDAISAMLKGVPDIRVTASPTLDPGFLSDATPHVVLLDSALGDDDGLRAVAEVRRDLPDLKFVAMQFSPSRHEIVAFVNAGVSGFVCADAGFEEFVESVRAVAAGGRVLPPSMTKSLFSEIANPAGAKRGRAAEPVHITRREREVIDLIGAGFCNKEIAQRLNIATHTVKTHVRKVMDKLALHTRLQIAAHMHRTQSLVTPRPQLVEQARLSA